MYLKKISLAVSVSLSMMAGEVLAHGSLTDPVSRSYYCRFIDDPENLQSEACRQAKQKSGTTQLFYDWMGILQPNANDNHRAIIPDGKLCSGGDSKPFVNGVSMMEGYNLQSADWQ